MICQVFTDMYPHWGGGDLTPLPVMVTGNHRLKVIEFLSDGDKDSNKIALFIRAGKD